MEDAATSALHEQQRRVAGHFRAVITEGVDAGVFRPVEVAPAALGIIGMCNFVTTWYRPEGTLSVSAIADVYAAMAVGALMRAD